MITARRKPATGSSSGHERGSAAVELVILTPGLILFLMLAIYGGRYALARQGVQAAAADAARSASIARTASAAGNTARANAHARLASEGLNCLSTAVTIDTSGFNAPIGTAASISAQVSCTVDLSDLGMLGLPGSRRVSAQASSPLDTYRER